MTTTIWERIVTALTSLGVPMAPSRYLTATGSDLPDQFLVFSLVSSPPEQSADDRETMRSYRVQVSVYDRSGLAELPDINTAMTAAGFQRGPIRELPFDQETRHYGLALEYVYLESED